MGAGAVVGLLATTHRTGAQRGDTVHLTVLNVAVREVDGDVDGFDVHATEVALDCHHGVGEE